MSPFCRRVSNAVSRRVSNSAPAQPSPTTPRHMSGDTARYPCCSTSGSSALARASTTKTTGTGAAKATHE